VKKNTNDYVTLSCYGYIPERQAHQLPTVLHSQVAAHVGVFRPLFGVNPPIKYRNPEGVTTFSFCIYRSKLAVAKQLCELFNAKYLGVDNGSINLAPIDLKSMSTHLLEEQIRTIESFGRAVANAVDRSVLPSGYVRVGEWWLTTDRIHRSLLAVSVKGRMTVEEARKVAEKYCRRHSFPGTNQLRSIVKSKTGRTCGQSTILNAIKSSPKLLILQRECTTVNQERGSSFQGLQMDGLYAQSREKTPAEALCNAELQEKLDLIRSDERLQQLLKDSSDEQRTIYLEDYSIERLKNLTVRCPPGSDDV